MGRATDALMDQLHGEVTTALIDEIKTRDDEVVLGISKDGKPITGRKGISPAMVAAAIKMLKDNGVDAPARLSPKVDALAAELADLDLDDVDIPTLRQ
jgi:hypothetical protein